MTEIIDELREDRVEAAKRLDVDAVLTYDRRPAEAARSTGLDIVAPGAAPVP